MDVSLSSASLVMVVSALALLAILGFVRRRKKTLIERSPSVQVHTAAAPAKTQFNLRRLIEECARPIAERAHAKGLGFKIVIAANLPRQVRSDPSRLRLILTHLLINAVQATAEGVVRLEVLLETDRRYLRCNVLDTGVGLDAETLARLLKSRDSGHGLADTLRALEELRGTLGAVSEPRGGSTFWFCIPLDPGRATPPSRTKKVRIPVPRSAEITAEPLLPRAARSGTRVLVVMNEPAGRIAALSGVRALGYLAELSGSVASTREAWLHAPFDLVLLDCAMAEAEEIIAAIRGHENGCVPVVGIGENPRNAHSPLDYWLPKPVCLLELARTLDHWLGAGAVYASEDSSDKLSLPV